MITIENLTKNFGRQVLLDKVGLKINPKERIGLVGRNGHGKTTFFKILLGEEAADDGDIIVPRGYTIGCVRQHIEFTEDSVLKEGMKGLSEHERDHSWKIEKILAGLGFSKTDMQRHPTEFSGGYQVRLNLAKALVAEPNLLLLDEPTNYLDITSIRWIERFLLGWPNELMLITHDRSFMDKVVTHTVAIHRNKLKKIAGDTGKLYTRIALEEEVYENTRVNDERRRKEVEVFINRFRAKARLANMVQSRIKALERSEKKDKLESIQTLDFAFKPADFNAKQLMSAQHITFGYDPDIPLIKNFSLNIGARDRICIIGRNGKGKTTLLKLLAGVLAPQHGEILMHSNTRLGLFEQTNVNTLVDKRTVEEEIASACPSAERQIARNIAGAMMFEGDNALKRIEVLSGGEKSRVMLGKLLMTPLNLLLLDEPTNHLDMESCDAMIGALDSFDGAVVMVTHNEMFLHALAERLVIFQQDQALVFEGTYESFIEKIGWDEETEISATDKESAGKINKKEIRKQRSEIITERSAVIKPIETRMKKVEAEIEAKESELAGLNQAMVDASHEKNGAKIQDISIQIHNCKTTVDNLFDELDELTNKFEEQTALFEERLREIDT